MESGRFLYLLGLCIAMGIVVVEVSKRVAALETFAIAHGNATGREYQALNERLNKLEKPARKPAATTRKTTRKSG